MMAVRGVVVVVVLGGDELEGLLGLRLQPPFSGAPRRSSSGRVVLDLYLLVLVAGPNISVVVVVVVGAVEPGRGRQGRVVVGQELAYRPEGARLLLLLLLLLVVRVGVGVLDRALHRPEGALLAAS